MGETTTIPIPFAEGLTQQDAIEWMDSGASASGVLNGNFTKAGAVDKRLGIARACLASSYLPLQGSPWVASMAVGVRAVSWSRCALGAAGFDATGLAGLYSVLDDRSGYLGIGPLPPPTVVRRGLPSATTPTSVTTTPSLVDVPDGQGGIRRLCFYVSGTATWMVVINADTGDLVNAPVKVYTLAPTSISAIYLGSAAPVASAVAVLLFFAGTGGGVGSMVGLSVSATGNAYATNLTSTPCYAADITPFVGDPSGGMVVFYQGASKVFQWAYWSSTWSGGFTGVVESPPGGSTSGIYPLLVAANYGEQIAFLYEYEVAGPGFDVRYAAIHGGSPWTPAVDPKTIASGAQAVFLSGIARIASATFFVDFFELVSLASNFAPSGSFGWVDATGAYERAGALPFGLFPTAKPFVVNGTPYQPAVTQFCYQTTAPGADTPQSEQCTLYLLQFANVTTASPNPCLPVATVAPRQVNPTFSYFWGITQAPPPCSAFTGTRFAVGVKTAAEDLAGLGQSLGAAWSADFRFDSTTALNWKTDDVDGAAHIAGSVPMISDGTQTYEDNFFYYPEFVVASLAASGTTAASTGEYLYAVCYKHIDGTGQLSRGSPVFSDEVSVTNGGVPAVVSFPPLSTTYRDLANSGQVYAEIYRTTVGGETLYLLTEVACEGNTVVTYTDTAADSIVQTASVLYITGGICDCVNPPSLSCQVVHWNRLWGVDDTLRTVWFTKALTVGETPGWNEAFTFSVPRDVTAMYSMDDKLIIGDALGLSVVYGYGPGDNAQGSDLTLPQPIACDAGPVDWRSGVVFPGGLIYRSPTGFMLCDRSLNVSWIGKDVVDTLASYPTVLSATVVPTATQVRFVCVSGTGASTVLVYDYLVGKWIQHTYPQQTTGVASAMLAPSTADRAGSFAMVTADGNLWQEHVTTDGNAYYDESPTPGTESWVTTSVTTSWLKIQGVQGYQRARKVQLLFEELDDCAVTMSFAVNYQAAIQQTNTWTSQIIDSLPRKLLEQHLAATLGKQLALQVTVSDSPGANATNGKGARFVGLNAELEQLSATYRQIPAIGRA